MLHLTPGCGHLGMRQGRQGCRSEHLPHSGTERWGPAHGPPHADWGLESQQCAQRKRQVNSGFSPSLAWWHLSLPTKDLLASLS